MTTDPRTSKPPSRSQRTDDDPPRPEPIAKPPERPRVKWLGVGCLFFVLFTVWFLMSMGSTLFALYVHDRHGWFR